MTVPEQLDAFATESKQHHIFVLLSVCRNQMLPLPGQADPTILGYNLLNEPRCNCAPQVIDASTGLATQDGGTDCENIEKCFTNVQASTGFGLA